MEKKTASLGSAPRLPGRTWLCCLLVVLALPALAEGATREHRLRWIAPSDPDLAGYELYLALAPGAYTNGVNIGVQPADSAGFGEYVVRDLDETLDYYVSLRAYDEAGNLSAFSNEIAIARVPEPDPTPAANPSLSGFVLWNHQPADAADCFQPGSAQDAVALANPFVGGNTVDLSQLTCACLGLELKGNADVRSVRIQHQVEGGAAHDMQENGAPLAYRYAPGQHVCTPELLEVGQHHITATPCSVETDQPGSCAANGGVAGTPIAIQFQVAAPEPEPVPQVEPPVTGCEDSFSTPGGARLSWTDDPTRTMTVVWDAAFHADGALLRYRPQGTATWTQREAALVSFMDCDARYRVDLVGLTPDKSYEYQVSTLAAGGPIWSTTRRLRPAPERAGSFDFSFFASSGLAGAADSAASLSVMERLGQRARVVLGGGGYAYAQDSVDAGIALDALDGVDRWLEQASRFARSTPFMPVYGDTEVASPEQRELYTTALPTFETPGGTLHSYSFDIDGVHFVGLDAPTLASLDPASEEGAAKLAWLDADLAEARAAGAFWLVVYMHSDLYSSEAGAEPAPEVQAALGEIFSQHGVALVLSGDGHSTERSLPIRYGTEGSQVMPADGLHSAREGTVFVRTGLGGRTDYADWAGPAPEWSALRDNTRPTFVQVRVSGGSMFVKIVSIDDAGKRDALERFQIRW